jgi:hypothetical protein
MENICEVKGGCGLSNIRLICHGQREVTKLTSCSTIPIVFQMDLAQRKKGPKKHDPIQAQSIVLSVGPTDNLLVLGLPPQPIVSARGTAR